IEPYFAPARMEPLEPRCRTIAAELIDRLPSGEIEVMSQLAEDFALQAQCAFLGWSVDLHAPLRDWVRKNHAATRSRNRAARGVGGSSQGTRYGAHRCHEPIVEGVRARACTERRGDRQHPAQLDRGRACNDFRLHRHPHALPGAARRITSAASAKQETTTRRD